MLCYLCVQSLVLGRLSVPVYVIDWKNSSPKSEMTYNVLMGTLNHSHGPPPPFEY